MPRLLVAALALFALPLAAQPVNVGLSADTVWTEGFPRARWMQADSSGVGLGGVLVRSVREAAALLPRVRGDFHSGRLVVGAHPGALNPRADWYPYLERAGQEPVFVVDGVRVADGLEVPFEAVASVEAMTGFVPARYGETAGGLILVETERGASRYGGEVEVGTSEGLDAYGHSRAAFQLGGPLSQRGRFSVSGAWRHLGDASPYGIETFRLSDEAFAALQSNPQVLRVTNGNPEQDQFVTLPVERIPDGTLFEDVMANPESFGLVIPDGYSLVNGSPLSASETLTAEDFETVRGKDDPLRDLRLYASASLRATSSIQLDLGGGLQRERADNTAAPAEHHAAQLYARESLYEAERDGYVAWGRFRQALSPTAAYEVRADYQRWEFVSFPSGFTSNVADALFYGDIDAEANGVARRYLTIRDGEFERSYSDGLFFGQSPRAYGTFFGPSYSPDRYRRRSGSAFTASGKATTQIGGHRIAFGAEFERQTRRAFEIAGQGLAVLYADGSSLPLDGIPPGGVEAYNELPDSVLRPITIVRYGYDALGLSEVDGQDLDGYFDSTDTDVAPYQPIYYAGYLEDRITWPGLSLDLGLRVEAFDANTDVLFDPFAVVPIVRVRDVSGAFSGAAPDWAVYFTGSGDEIAGYRDRNGTFYDAAGAQTSEDDVRARGRVDIKEGAPRSEAFERSSVHVVWQPRLGVSMDVGESVRAFAYYARQARRPAPEFFAPFSVYADSPGERRIGNARLRPEVLDAFGLGATFAVGEGLGVSAVLFYDRHNDLPTARSFQGDFGFYSTILGGGTLDTYGVTMAATLARTRGLTVDADYTLSFASGTGSDPTLFSDPLFVGQTNPADFDIRHAVRAVAAYRAPDDFYFLGGIGTGLVFTAQSGRPYTATTSPSFVTDPTSGDIASGINEERRPGLHRFDAWIDKRFAVGTAGLTAFLKVENVLGTKNELAVYRASGEAATDGFLETPSGESYLASALSPASAAFNYTAYAGGPANVGGSKSTDGTMLYGRPRQFHFGLRLSL